ncbi:mariner Mos1 transposase [Trichonephila clavipes]|nr:mariner Mos1 transposase [Trichonephila clavipes]
MMKDSLNINKETIRTIQHEDLGKTKGYNPQKFVLTAQTITGQYCLAVLRRLMARIRRIRAEYWTESSWCLLHDNASSHTFIVVRRFLTNNNVCVLNHTPYLPALTPCDYSLLPKFKMKLKWCYFEDILTLQVSSTHALQAIPQRDLQQAFYSLINHYNKCIEAGGSKFE